MVFKIAVFGASGPTGVQLVEQALEAGHHVQALVRSPEKFQIKHERLSVVKGDVTKLEDVTKTIEGQDVVIVTIGGLTKNVHADGQRNVIESMKKLGVKRLVVVTSIGLGDSFDKVPFVFKIIWFLLLQEAFKDKEIQEKLVRESGLDFTIVRPGGLLNGPKRGGFQIDPTNQVFSGSIDRSDVAAFCLSCLEPNSPYLSKTVSITQPYKPSSIPTYLLLFGLVAVGVAGAAYALIK